MAFNRSRRVQKYKRTLRPARRAVAEFIYHHRGERNHQGLGNAFVFLDTTPSLYLPEPCLTAHGGPTQHPLFDLALFGCAVSGSL